MSELREWAIGLRDNDAGWHSHGDTLHEAGLRILELLDQLELGGDGMSDHAEIVRNALPKTWITAEQDYAPNPPWLAALDALVAERDQLRKRLNHVDTHLAELISLWNAKGPLDPIAPLVQLRHFINKESA